ncbi:murein biosynthesis integral membrane protein MurJ [Streptomyces chromofuscus]|uniref:Murein biosynthesis protein MurJ n=1 Tax=Streptomyces chromofuscus TaxID=42881 RepID=A0A7M2THJ0_STRCW|nr:lipid II flippase MurJ [Streptomyces chromofuscus]QOV46751.1 murein biosynthesis protein MurJ [Streptomyces chromofuscus]GGT40731.1 membrane protein [Streptomyces chromofuscus]
MNMTPPRTPRSVRPTVPSARPAPPAGDGAEPPSESRGFLAKAALLTAALSVAGASLGLARDQALARLFGAGRETDAFLVAWTVPEFAATLLIEDGLALVLIPAFSLALSRRAQGAPGDPVRALVATTLPRLSLALVTSGGLVVVGTPFLVDALAPGLPDHALAVDCTRLTATCVLSFGLAGYCSAALRAHRRFLAPAAIYVAYNTGIIATMLVLGGQWGVRSAAVGVAAGGCLMVAIQLPALLRQLRRKSAGVPADAGETPRPVGLALVCAVLLFALCRQSQVLVERFIASHLDPGAISHLNYAQKVAQIPMTLSLMLVTVTFPVVARALADGDTERARDRVERDLALAACIVLLGAATVIACAPQIIELLFQRGAFTAQDTAATADVMRVYALGLLGQTLVGGLLRTYFCDGRPNWYPLAAMTAGITATAAVGAGTVGPWGVSGLAAANAAGITLTAGLLLGGARAKSSRRSGLADDSGTGVGGTPTARNVVPLRLRHVLTHLGRPLGAAFGATASGAFAASRFEAPLPGLLMGVAAVAVVFVLLGVALGEQGVASALRSVRSVTRRLPYVRSR